MFANGSTAMEGLSGSDKPDSVAALAAPVASLLALHGKRSHRVRDVLHVLCAWSTKLAGTFPRIASRTASETDTPPAQRATGDALQCSRHRHTPNHRSSRRRLRDGHQCESAFAERRALSCRRHQVALNRECRCNSAYGGLEHRKDRVAGHVDDTTAVGLLSDCGRALVLHQAQPPSPVRPRPSGASNRRRLPQESPSSVG